MQSELMRFVQQTLHSFERLFAHFKPTQFVDSSQVLQQVEETLPPVAAELGGEEAILLRIAPWRLGKTWPRNSEMTCK